MKLSTIAVLTIAFILFALAVNWNYSQPSDDAAVPSIETTQPNTITIDQEPATSRSLEDSANGHVADTTAKDLPEWDVFVPFDTQHTVVQPNVVLDMSGNTLPSHMLEEYNKIQDQHIKYRVIEWITDLSLTDKLMTGDIEWLAERISNKDWKQFGNTSEEAVKAHFRLIDQN